MYRFYFLVLALISFSSYSQKKDFVDPDSILIGNKELPKVLLIGSFHFNYPGLDAHKTDEDSKINIYSVKRQKELKELLDYIALFKPTKIVVESGANTGYLMKNLERYKAGKKDLYPNERSQIGMRLVDRFDLDTVYGSDTGSLALELMQGKEIPEESYIEKILKRHYFGGTDSISNRYSDFYSYKDRMYVEKTLLESFKYINTDKVLDRGFGAYIAGGQFDSEKFEGADALSLIWFNRNLRIFRNIQKIDHDAEDRILVLFGAGHISILKFLFETSPQFKLVNFNELKKFNKNTF